MADVLEFYADPGRLTEVSRHEELLKGLPDDLGELTRIIQGVGIYDVVAPDFYGVEVPKSRVQEIHHRSVSDMLAGVLALDDAALTTARPPELRLFCRCGGFTRLLVGMLRARGVPARARCGFAAYLNPGHFEDHWVGEVWNAEERHWRLVDAQLDEVWRTQLKIDDDVLDIPRNSFLVAADAWRRCRVGEEDPETFGITFGGLHGLWFVAGSLVRDLAALNKMEMLPWDVWGAQPAPDQALDKDRLAFFDELAALTQDPDSSFDALRRRYQSDDHLRVPPKVFNALREQEEAAA
jgi:Transglutaminase-like superfamily